MLKVGDRFINTSNLTKMEIVYINESEKKCKVKSLRDNSVKEIEIEKMIDAIAEYTIEKI